MLWGRRKWVTQKKPWTLSKASLIFTDAGYTPRKWQNRANNKILSLQNKFLFVSVSEQKIAYVTHAFNIKIYADSAKLHAHYF